MGHNPTYNLLHTRVRLDVDGLNSESSGWIAAEDADSFDVDWGVKVRIRARFSETAGNGSNNTFKWQVSRESGSFVDVTDAIYPNAATPVIVVPSDIFTDGDSITTQYLTSGGGTFINGEGDSDNSISSTVDSQETEIETCFMIMNPFGAEGATGNNSDGDTLEFRLVENDGTVFGGTENTVIIIVNDTNDGYIGGTYAETPGHLFFVDGDKNMYCVHEISAGDPLIAVSKSTNGGDNWTIQDQANGPTTSKDLEAFDAILANDRIYMAQQNTGDDVYHHVFVVSTDGTSPDTWETVDEAVTTGITMNSNPQSVAIGRRSDGDLIIFYVKDNGSVDQGYYKIDSGSGWGSEQTLDAESGYWVKGIAGIMGESDLFHVFYKMANGTLGPIYHRSLNSSDTLSGREAIDTDAGGSTDDRFFMTNPVYWDDGGDEIIMVCYYDAADSKIYSVVVTNDGTPETRKAASDNTAAYQPGNTGSDQVVADLSIDGSDAFLHYANAADLDLYRDLASNDGGWGTDVEELDATTIHWIRTHVFTHSAGNGGAKVVGQVYDKGSDGETGYIWYREYEIPSAGPDPLVAAAGSFSLTGQAAGLIHDKLLTAAFGTFSLTGQATGLLASRLLDAAFGAFNLTGQDAGLLTSRLLTAESGTFTLAGQDAGLLRQWGDLVAASGTFNLTGQAAGLIHDKLLTAAFGTFSLTGQDAGLLTSRLLDAAFGTFTLTGQDAGISKIIQLLAESGTFSLTGQDAGLLTSRLLTAESGTINLAGQDAGLLASRLLDAAFGTFTLTGQDAAISKIILLLAESGTFTLTGQDAGLLTSRLLTAESGAINLAGQDAGLLKQWADLVAASGTFNLTGQDAGLLTSRLLTAESGTINLAGQDVGLLASRLLTATNGTFTLTGQDINLIIAVINFIIEQDSIIVQVQEQDSTIVQIDEQDSTIVQVQEQDSIIKGDYET
jgi:hypothetical protein